MNRETGENIILACPFILQAITAANVQSRGKRFPMNIALAASERLSAKTTLVHVQVAHPSCVVV